MVGTPEQGDSSASSPHVYYSFSAVLERERWVGIPCAERTAVWPLIGLTEPRTDRESPGSAKGYVVEQDMAAAAAAGFETRFASVLKEVWKQITMVGGSLMIL